MNFRDRIMARARQSPKRIVLCEGEELRLLTAAAQAASEGLAQLHLVGDSQKIAALAGDQELDIRQLQLVDPHTSALRPRLEETLLDLRRKRGMTPQQAEAAVLQPLTFAMLMLREGHADGSVAG